MTSFCDMPAESEVVCFSAQGGSNKNGGDSPKSSRLPTRRADAVGIEETWTAFADIGER